MAGPERATTLDRGIVRNPDSTEIYNLLATHIRRTDIVITCSRLNRATGKISTSNMVPGLSIRTVKDAHRAFDEMLGADAIIIEKLSPQPQ